MSSLDVRAEDVTGEEEPAFDEVVGLLEVAVLVLDDDVAVIAGPPQRTEQAVPFDVSEPWQAGDLPADAHREDPPFVEALAVDEQVLGLDMEDVGPELSDEPGDVDHLEDQVRRVEVEPDRAGPLLQDAAPHPRRRGEVVAARPLVIAEQHRA